jgi:hypothetical protein
MPRIEEQKGAPTNKYARKIGPVAGRQAARAKAMTKSSDSNERRHGSITLGQLDRRLASKKARGK